MARLVFRRYIHLTPSSCTSERLRTSTRRLSGFIQSRYRSPSFGSHRYVSSSSKPDATVVSLVRDSRRVRYHLLLNRLQFHFSSSIFSNFDSPTSSLSVIWPYLALDHHHHLIHTALPNNATLHSLKGLSPQEPSITAYEHDTLSEQLPQLLQQQPTHTQLATDDYHMGSSAFPRWYSRNPS